MKYIQPYPFKVADTVTRIQWINSARVSLVIIQINFAIEEPEWCIYVSVN